MAIAYPETVTAPIAPRPFRARLLSIATGFLVWTLLALAFGHVENDTYVVREAWDTGPYWSLGLILFALASAFSGYLAPHRVWRWPLWIALGQAVAMILFHPPDSGLSLVPISIIFVGLPLVLIMALPALIGGAVALRGWSPSLLA